MDSQEIALINELALVTTQQQLDEMQIKIALDFLTPQQAYMVEQTRGKVLDWIDWFRNHHDSLNNRFTLSVSSKGRPPLTIGAAVFSYDMENHVVNIHMVEHFKRIVFEDHLVKRMGFVALNVALFFASSAQATHIRVINPLEHAVSYYKYLTFERIDDGCMEATLQSVRHKLQQLTKLGGQHDFEWDD